MASEIVRSPETNRLPANVQGVVTGITKAAGVQPKEAIDHAIQSFNSIKEKQIGPEFLQLNDAAIQVAGHADHPSKYFTHAFGKDLNDSGIVPMDQLVANLRRNDLNFQQGVSSFLKCGIQEALASLKINPDPKVERPAIPIPLDELISPEKLRNPDRKKLQTSVQVINEMFRSLKSIQSDVSELRLRMLSNVRA